tara:strand:+ start:3334 stop:4053 length:720 start_codon:yes stop_codon:yes gene_type:complete
MTTPTPPKNMSTDIIVLIDSSGSMSVMGEEPIKSANEFISKQQKNNDESILTVISFSSDTKKLIKNKPIQEVEEISQDKYIPSGSTSLNDCICTVISKRLSSNKVNDVILLIITDGHENSSKHYNRKQTKDYLELVQTKYNWQVLFIGANINSFEEGQTLSINSDKCAQFDQNCPGNLLSLMRTASDQITDYKRAKTEGIEDAVLSMPLQSHKSEPIHHKKNYEEFSIPNFPIPTLIRS